MVKRIKTKKVKKKKKDYEKIIIGVLVVCLIAAIGYGIVNLDRFVQNETDDREIVASVNGEAIYKDVIDKKLMYLQAQLGPMITWEFTLNHTINQHILLQKANEMGITVDEQKIIEGVEQWFDQLDEQMDPDQLQTILAMQNVTLEEFKNDTIRMYIDDFVVFTLFNDTIFSTIDESQYTNGTVTDEEILEHYEANKDSFVAIDASHILVCYTGAASCTQNRTKEEAETRINEVYQMLLDSGDFEDIAKEYSDGPSGPAGGNLGEFPKGQMVPAFEEAAFALKPSQLSDIVETDFGFHIIKLNSRKEGYENFKTQISFQLQYEKQQLGMDEIRKVQEIALTKYLSDLRSESDIRYYTANPEIGKDVATTPGIMTFSVKENEICTENGKPIIRLFSTNSCPHCKWIGETYDTMMRDLEKEGKIVAHHWKLDTEDDSISTIKETFMPEEEKNVYFEFNPRGSVPTFVFGCKYYRIGNGYESEDSLTMEKAEFTAVIDRLIEETQ